MLVPLILTFDITHITKPAGAATHIALPNTNSVRSNNDLIITFLFEAFYKVAFQEQKMMAFPLILFLKEF